MIILMDTCGGHLRFDELYASFGFRKPRHRRAKDETAPMKDQNHLNAFNQAVTAAKGRHQQAVRDAHEEFIQRYPKPTASVTTYTRRPQRRGIQSEQPEPS